MATNLVSTIMQSFSSEVIGKLASTLGLEQATAQRGISAAIPGILASIANAVSSSDGAQKIGTALSRADEITGRGGDIVKNVMESNKSVLEMGWSAISSLIGANGVERLTSMVAQYAGFGQGSAKKLLGFLVPVVLGFLRREQLQSGLDNRGLAGMLASQKSNIERAMPEGLMSRMADTDTGPSVRQTSPAYRQASAAQGRSSSSWAYWLLPALIIAGAALYLLPSQESNQNAKTAANRDTAQVNPPAQHDVQPAPVSTNAAITSPTTLENDILSNISRLRGALQKIKDPASAQAAVGELREISDRFARLKSVAQQMSPEARKTVAAAVSSKMPDLNSLLDRIGNEINLSGDVKPAMDTLKTELANLSKA